jgi:5-methyltetrahydrofolate--homocysteine methyltransferase
VETTLEKIHHKILIGNRDAVEREVRVALDMGLSPESLLKEGMIPAMEQVGARFEAGEYFVPEMLVAADAMKAGLVILKPQLIAEGVQAIGKAVIGTVLGDLHDIGKNLVAMLLEGAGFEVIDLGTNVSPEDFVQQINDLKPDLVGLSALLTTTMINMRGTIEAIQLAGLREQVKIIVGGAPVNADFALESGADGYAPDASRAAVLAKGLLE